MPITDPPDHAPGWYYPSNSPGGVVDNGVRRTVGVDEVTGSATIATGLTVVDGVTASLEVVGVAAGDPFLVAARPSATPGAVDVDVLQDDGTAATAPAVVHWTACTTGLFGAALRELF